MIYTDPGSPVQPFHDHLYKSSQNYAHLPYANCRLQGGGTNLYLGFTSIYIPHPVRVAGLCNQWAGVAPSDTSIGLRVALYNSYSVNGLPSTPISGSDTGSFTYASFLQSAVVSDQEFRKTYSTPIDISVPGYYWVAFLHVTSATISGDQFRGIDHRGGQYGLPNLVWATTGDTSSANANIASYSLPTSATPAAGSFTKSPAATSFCNINWGLLCQNIG